MTQHRLGHGEGVDDVVGALDPQPELLSSHRTAAIERRGVSLEWEGSVLRRYFPGCAHAHPLTAAPRGSAESKRAKTMIRFAAL
jgi:hypothetical protein